MSAKPIMAWISKARPGQANPEEVGVSHASGSEASGLLALACLALVKQRESKAVADVRRVYPIRGPYERPKPIAAAVINQSMHLISIGQSIESQIHQSIKATAASSGSQVKNETAPPILVLGALRPCSNIWAEVGESRGKMGCPLSSCFLSVMVIRFFFQSL